MATRSRLPLTWLPLAGRGCFCASPAMFADGQRDARAEEVKNLQFCDLKSCVSTHSRAEGKAAGRPPAQARLCPGPQEGRGSAPTAQRGRLRLGLRGSGAGRGPPRPAHWLGGTQAGGTEQRAPRGWWGRAGPVSWGQQMAGVPLGPEVDWEAPRPQVPPGPVPRQRPAHPGHPPWSLDPVSSHRDVTSRTSPPPPPRKESGVPSEPRAVWPKPLSDF